MTYDPDYQQMKKQITFSEKGDLEDEWPEETILKRAKELYALVSEYAPLEKRLSYDIVSFKKTLRYRGISFDICVCRPVEVYEPQGDFNPKVSRKRVLFIDYGQLAKNLISLFENNGLVKPGFFPTKEQKPDAEFYPLQERMLYLLEAVSDSLDFLLDDQKIRYDIAEKQETLLKEYGYFVELSYADRMDEPVKAIEKGNNPS